MGITSVLTIAASSAMLISILLSHQMQEEQLKAFLEAVKSDTTLQERLKAAADADSVVSIAKAAGFTVSTDALQRAQAEISEKELEGTTGGSFGCQSLGAVPWRNSVC